MNYKRKKAKNQRSWWLLCKPHKANGADRWIFQEIKQDGNDKRNRSIVSKQFTYQPNPIIAGPKTFERFMNMQVPINKKLK